MTTLVSHKAQKLMGTVYVPGDKSISHRALILSALSAGRSTVRGLLESDDVMRTAQALEAMGVTFKKNAHDWIIHGVGIGGLKAPQQPLDFGNSGTGARLMMGVLATHNFSAELVGDQSLSRRPMGRVMTPLREFGAEFLCGADNTLPIKVIGCPDPLPVRYKLPVASAQVKSAILLAALNTPGVTTVIEPAPTRDHTERLLVLFGADLKKGDKGQISILGQPELIAQNLIIPGDFSSAAFLIVAALICADSEIRVKNSGINPLRTGLLTVLQKMGADIKLRLEQKVSGEMAADILVKASALKGVAVGPKMAPLMIDEYPIAFIAAALAKGATGFSGLEELKHKESDRLTLMTEGLRANGVQVEMGRDSIIIHGTGGLVRGGGQVDAHHDHRIAMAFLVLGLAAQRPITLTGAETIATSFPDFVEVMRGLGAEITEQS